MQNQVRQMPTRLRNAIHIAYASAMNECMNEWIISTKQLCEANSLSVLGVLARVEHDSNSPEYIFISISIAEADLMTLNF